MVFMGRAPGRGLVQVVLVRWHRQDGDALVDQLEHVGRAGLAADGALLGVAVVDAAGFFGEALADVFGGGQAIERRPDGTLVGASDRRKDGCAMGFW